LMELHRNVVCNMVVPTNGSLQSERRDAVWTRWLQDNCELWIKEVPALWGCKPQSPPPHCASEAASSGLSGKRKRKPSSDDLCRDLQWKVATLLGECAKGLLCSGWSCKVAKQHLDDGIDAIVNSETIADDTLKKCRYDWAVTKRSKLANSVGSQPPSST
jgi:hypothetical protein